jgi:putative cell wall binding repeat protein
VLRAVRRSLATLAALAFLIAGCSLGDDDSLPGSQGAPGDDEKAAEQLGFPHTATRNTIRVAGGDASSDAAGVASALFPATGEADRPGAVVLVDRSDWQSAIAASVLAGPPIGAPLLLSDGSGLPAVTADTLNKLDPRGSDLSKDAQVIRIGDGVARPSGYKTAVIEGEDAYERAAAVDRFFSAARGRPSPDVVLYSGEAAEWSMPAAAWAARSGNAALPVKRDSIPDPIRRALQEHERPNVYVLGPEQAISNKVVQELEKGLAGSVNRVSGPTPVENAINFARYRQGSFGWGVEVPGYNFTVASTSRPLDVAAAASLATRGVFAPLLLTDEPADLPRALESYFLSVQPGYEDDPGQAVYNRVWILGGENVVSMKAQARLDSITELIPVQATAP